MPPSPHLALPPLPFQSLRSLRAQSTPPLTVSARFLVSRLVSSSSLASRSRPSTSTSSSSSSSSFASSSTSPPSTSSHPDIEGWETIIGLEIHAQLKTPRKLFSRAKLRYGDASNTLVDPLDAAFPGTLPVLDPEAIRLSILTALALDCDINTRSTFDRKHYFYHDIPSSYQITQHYNPLARRGKLRVDAARSFDVGIQQLQVEQDTAKSQKVGGHILVDLNRSGAGLMEIVTDPDMRSPEEAGAFVRRLQGLLRRVGSGDGDMEKGNLRVDANVSVRRYGEPFGTRCEIKNLNSVRFLQQAIDAERRRHVKHYETSPGVPLKQETRGLDEVTGETFSLRSKEDAEDYRYMPDSNLPAVVVDSAYLEKLRTEVPEMPWETTKRLIEVYGVGKREAETLVALDEYGGAGVRYFEIVAGDPSKGLGKKSSNWTPDALDRITNEILGQFKKANKEWGPEIVPPGLVGEVVAAVEGGEITGSTGRQVLRQVVQNGVEGSPTLSNLLDTLGLTFTTPLPSTPSLSSPDLASPTSPTSSTRQSSPSPSLEEYCTQAIVKLPRETESVRAGNERVAMRLVGEVMKLSKGSADAKRAREVLLSLIKGGI